MEARKPNYPRLPVMTAAQVRVFEDCLHKPTPGSDKWIGVNTDKRQIADRLHEHGYLEKRFVCFSVALDNRKKNGPKSAASYNFSPVYRCTEFGKECYYSGEARGDVQKGSVL